MFLSVAYTLSRTNLADPRLPALKARKQKLIEEGRGAVTQVMTDIAKSQALFLVAGAVAHQAGQARLRGQVERLTSEGAFVHQEGTAPHLDYEQNKIVGDKAKVSPGELAQLERARAQSDALKATVPDALTRQRIVESLGGRAVDVVEDGNVTGVTRQGGRRVLRVARNASAIQIEGASRLPADLREQVSIEIDPTLPPREVYVVPEPQPAEGAAGAPETAGRTTNALRPRIRMRVSAEATLADIQAHAGAVRSLQNALGLRRRVRLLLAQVTGRHLVPGSRADIARGEVKKLEPMVEALQASLARPGVTPEQQAALGGELADLDAQLQEHQQTLRSGDTTPADLRIAVKNDATLRAQAPDLLRAAHQNGLLPARYTNWTDFFRDYYFSQMSDGTYQITRKDSAPADAPALQLKYPHGTNALGQAFLEASQDLDRSFPGAKGRAGQSTRAQALTNFPELEDVLQEKLHPAQSGQTAWTAGDAAMLRGWGEVLREARAHLGLDITPLLARVRALPPGYGETAYQRFYRDVRLRLVRAIVGIADKRQQMLELRYFASIQPENKSLGELFTLWREVRMEAATPTHPGGDLSPSYEAVHGVSINIERPGPFRFADGVLRVRESGGAGAPPKGKTFLTEDKAGTDAFKLTQAQEYSAQLDQGAHTISTRTTAAGPGGSYDGIVYFFESRTAAENAMTDISLLNSHIYVGYFDTNGNLNWVPRP